METKKSALKLTIIHSKSQNVFQLDGLIFHKSFLYLLYCERFMCLNYFADPVLLPAVVNNF